MTLFATFQSQELRIKQALRQPYQPVTSRPVKRAEAARRIPSDAHGTLSGYKTFRCRCASCRSAAAGHSARMRQQQRARKRATERQQQIDFFGSMREAS